MPLAGRLLGQLLVIATLLGLSMQPVAAQQQSGEPMLLEAEKLTITSAQGSFDFDVEIADDSSEQARGLMFRTDLPTRRGMLFDFGQSRIVAMWMKNTPLSLDMVFVLPDGSVASVAERTEPFSERIIPSGEPVSHVLELNAGVARLIGLKPGDKLVHRLFVK